MMNPPSSSSVIRDLSPLSYSLLPISTKLHGRSAKQRVVFPRAALDPLIGASSPPRARFAAKRMESVTVVQNPERPLEQYMRLPASQYSVLDAERIERVDENTFRCYVYKFKFFNFEVCPVLMVRVEVEPSGCCIRLLSCKLEGSPIVVQQNEKFSASMVNRISCSVNNNGSTMQQLISDTEIEVVIDIPFAFRALPAALIESSGNQVMEQILKIMLPRFLAQFFPINGQSFHEEKRKV
ncbi:uncharacterized protein LOC116265798 isoform X2 [Nymphaea colorata]|uniref:uncharacterized protein LOC116265798 isoform X2 n=1 Tax=Nymphaea colorata TaxID=210225 RepID=UPI00129E328E|nr:uncharacterized protein LOC116265798 isoform X2 [Nymphaea colorata]